MPEIDPVAAILVLAFRDFVGDVFRAILDGICCFVVLLCCCVVVLLCCCVVVLLFCCFTCFKIIFQMNCRRVKRRP